MGNLSDAFNAVARPAFYNEFKGPDVVLESMAGLTLDDDEWTATADRPFSKSGMVNIENILYGSDVTQMVDGTGYNIVVPRNEGESNKQWAARTKIVAGELEDLDFTIKNATHKGGRIYCEVNDWDTEAVLAFDMACKRTSGSEKIDIKAAMADVFDAEDFNTGVYDVLGEMNKEPDISFDHVPGWAEFDMEPTFGRFGENYQSFADTVEPFVTNDSYFRQRDVGRALDGSDVTKMVDGTGYNVFVQREEGESNKQWAVRAKDIAGELDGLGLHIKNETHKGGRIYCELHSSDDPEMQAELDDVKIAMDLACKRTSFMEDLKKMDENFYERLDVATDELNLSVRQVQNRLVGIEDIPMAEPC